MGEIANAPVGVVSQVKSIISSEKTKERFNEVLGNKAPQFLASVVNAVSGSTSLKKCDANSIMSAALVAATYDLPIDSNLGFSALVPYECSKKNPDTGKWDKVTHAQFQIMYKGFIQLAIRSGYYEKMNCSVVYEDELVSYNPITGECEFVQNFEETKQRQNGEHDKIVGYYAWFKLKSGFVKELYMTKQEVNQHAVKYSSAYRYDIDKDKNSSRWSQDFNSMALKTVIKRLLSKWGILSVEMQKAIQDDQKVYDEDGAGEYSDNQPDVEEAIDVFAREVDGDE